MTLLSWYLIGELFTQGVYRTCESILALLISLFSLGGAIFWNSGDEGVNMENLSFCGNG